MGDACGSKTKSSSSVAAARKKAPAEGDEAEGKKVDDARKKTGRKKVAAEGDKAGEDGETYDVASSDVHIRSIHEVEYSSSGDE